jgi:hypothetical protein
MNDRLRRLALTLLPGVVAVVAAIQQMPARAAPKIYRFSHLG